MKRSVFVVISLALAAPGQTVATRVQRILADPSGAGRGHWGILAVDLAKGHTLVARNANAFFTPASTLKLFTTAFALTRLGPEYRFSTIAAADTAPDIKGVLGGDLRLIGGGDPAMSWRAYPYEKGPHRGEALAAIEAFADDIVKRGIRRISGNVVGDDTRWPWMPYPQGWAIDDAIWEYGAPVSALTINDNAIQLTIHGAAEAGMPARITLNPPLEYYWIDNRVRTEAGARKIEVARDPGSRQIRLTGRIAPGGAVSQWIAIDDPALYAAHALHDALTRRSIEISGGPRARHRMPDEAYDGAAPAVELARRESPPLWQILQVVNKASQNLHAELLLRETAFRAPSDASLDSAAEEIDHFLTTIGISPEDYDSRDGSGLSRLSLVTPGATVRLLRHMVDSSHRDLWLSTMPVGGQDGTLENRFAGFRSQAQAVRAKTGSLTHVHALAGYLQSRTYGRVAFAIMVNGANAPSSEIRAAIDKICMELVK